MKDYSKVTAMEYFEKLKEVFNSLGREDGYCDGVICSDCPLEKYGPDCSNLDHSEEMIKVIMDYEIPVDWENVPVDTKILVKDYEEHQWKPRYFAKYEDGKVFTFCNGKTSFTTEETDIVCWNCAKLYRGDETK